jgi:CxxC-x17-CxxC domain-containing protein
MVFTDKSLQCVDCGADFVWTAGEQAFYADKQFTHEPRRCRACKSKRAAARPADPPSAAPPPVGPRESVEVQATCSSCGRATTVPFRPSQGRPVYCRGCFQQRKRGTR